MDDKTSIRHSLFNHPAAWLSVIGPGAVIASLSIGAGELVFSSRGGALFGYRLLGPIFLICLFKWALVLATARHIVWSGAHPVQRWMELPGSRGWLPITFMILAIVSFPIWIGFHAGTVGTLLSYLSGTRGMLRGADHFVWGLFVLAVVMLLVLTGGYQRLERLQLALIGIMMACVGASLILIRPNLGEMLTGMFDVANLHYPEWVSHYPEVSQRPLCVELATYVGVIGGSGFDYLAYVSYLREKNWGGAAGPVCDAKELEAVANDPYHAHRKWLIAPLVDCTVSFLVVFLFSAVFVVCGTLMLGSHEKIPTGSDLLTLQASFVGGGMIYWRPIYFVGAFLAIFGTLYGTVEVAPTIAREFALAVFRRPIDLERLRMWVIAWVGSGGAAVLVFCLARFLFSDARQPPELIAILTPANLFTGVLACGIIAILSLWSDFRFLPKNLRPSGCLILLNIVGGCGFLSLGVKSYWDQGGIAMMVVLLGTVAMGYFGARWLGR